MEINVRTHYPRSDEYEYETRLERINLDKEREYDIFNGNGFIVSAAKAIKDDLKAKYGIYSELYGPTLQDANPFANRYRCKCGHTTQRFTNGTKCPVCGEPVKFMDDNFKFFGWIVLKDPYYLIHPNLFMSIMFLIGERHFTNIITEASRKDEDGKDLKIKRPKDEPYYGIGMMEFHDKFDEIINYYAARNANKKEYYDDIVANRDKIFVQSIPVYTIHLRPYRLEGNDFHFEGTNAIFNIMAQLATHINNDRYKMNSKSKSKNQLLFDLQKQYIKLYDEIGNILKGKRGALRTLFGGRYNFTARSVIAPDPSVNIDEVKLSYQCLCGLMQQTIINILHKSYHMKYNEAYKMWAESMNKPNPIIEDILNGLIKSSGRGIPILINRNPTIGLGGIIQVYVVGICSGFTMSMPLQVLKGLAADFDGDTLNILLLINKEFIEAASYVFNPRNSMYISMNDGMFNNDYNHQRDTLINCNTMVRLSRDNYTFEQLQAIENARRAS